MVAEGKAREGQRDTDGKTRRKRVAKAPDTHVAHALRTAYQETVREDVPDDLLDLLGKLA